MKASRVFRFFATLIAVCCWSSARCADTPLATLREDVTTSFGTYHPRVVNVMARARQFALKSDFSNVVNFNRFEFTSEQRDLLRENLFVAMHGNDLEMHDVYLRNISAEIPSFVTVDLALHLFHLQFDLTLKTLEKEIFNTSLLNLTQALLSATMEELQSADDEPVITAASANAAYFAVALNLLDPETSATLPTAIQAMVDTELGQIESHAGIQPSPIFVAPHDYTQYIVRGHYEGDALLEHYFRAMMWYGSMRFALEAPQGVIIPEADLRRMILQALLVTRDLQRQESEGVRAIDLWTRIYQPTVFFVGRTDDLDLVVFDRVARQVYGENYLYLSADELARAEDFDRFVAAVRALPPPQIQTVSGRSFRFMGQRFLPDSWITENTATRFRIPYGLDVMTVLGGARAEQILRELYHDPPPEPALQELKTAFASMDPALWAQNMYWNWLYCLFPLLTEKGTGYPPYMQKPAWRDKDLAAALGSWAELRHDTILYGKGSGGPTSMPAYRMDQGTVEANPECFARLAALSRYMIDGLAGLDLLHEQFASSLTLMESILLQLEAVATKELHCEPITYEEYETIKTIGERVKELLSDQAQGDDMPVIADVHTQDGLALEEAVGYPLVLYVIVDVAGELRVTRGAAFSYYEFKQPIADRLTDSQWQTMLQEGAAPTMPGWMNSYFDPMISTAGERNPPYLEAYGKTRIELQTSATSLRPGDPLEVTLVNWNYSSHPQNYTAHLNVIRSDDSSSTIPLTQDPEHPNLYRGTIQTGDWPGDEFYLAGTLTHVPTGGTITYRTFVLLDRRSAVQGQRWTEFR